MFTVNGKNVQLVLLMAKFLARCTVNGSPSKGPRNHTWCRVDLKNWYQPNVRLNQGNPKDINIHNANLFNL